MDGQVALLNGQHLIKQRDQGIRQRIPRMGEIPPGKGSASPRLSQDPQELLQAWRNIMRGKRPVLLALVHIHQAVETQRRPHGVDTGAADALQRVGLDAIDHVADLRDAVVTGCLWWVPARAKEDIEEDDRAQTMRHQMQPIVWLKRIQGAKGYAQLRKQDVDRRFPGLLDSVLNADDPALV